MNCQDNSRLKVPLPELCRTADIGCVPVTDGKPDCPPESDQLPFSYDPNTKTLWIFECKSRQWVSFGKFSLGELQEVNLDNIRNICSLLNIPVFYNPGSGTIEGSMPLGEFAKKLMECVALKQKVAILSDGTVSFSVDGLDSLDPIYVKYENLTVTGKGTQADPLVIKASAPVAPTPTICALPEKTQAQLEAATKATLGACLDNENVRVPYPEQPKNYTIATQDNVDTANSRFLVGVINGQHRRIPFPPEACEYDTVTVDAATKANQADIIACVNGKEVKFSLKDLLDLIKGDDVADLNYSCVPVATGTPSGAPDPKVGPLMLDADGKSLWVWSCGDRRWIKISGGATTADDTPHAANWSSVADSVSNKCTGVTWDAWYADGSTLKPTRLTSQELGTILKSCLNLVDTTALNSLGTDLRGLITALTTRVAALENASGPDLGPLTTRVTTLEGKVNTLETDVNGLKTLTNTHTTQINGLTTRVTALENNSDASSGSVYRAFSNVGGGSCVGVTATAAGGFVYQARDKAIVLGNGSFYQGGSTIAKYVVKNPFDKPSLFQLDIEFNITASTMHEYSNMGVIVNAGEKENVTYASLFTQTDSALPHHVMTEAGSVTAVFAIASRNDGILRPHSTGMYSHPVYRAQLLTYSGVLAANASKTVYVNYWVSIAGAVAQAYYEWHANIIGTATIFKNHRTVTA